MIKIISGFTSQHLTGNRLIDPMSRESYSEIVTNGSKYGVESIRQVLMRMNRGSGSVSRCYGSLNKLRSGKNE